MKDDPTHIHKCNSGHGIRAISGIRVEKKRDDNVQLFASVQRCEEIEPLSTFRFNNKDIKWMDFCEQKKEEWDFTNSA
jgi:hypothetical protein